MNKLGKVNKETVVLHQWGVLQVTLVSSTELIVLQGHSKEFLQLTFQGLAHHFL